MRGDVNGRAKTIGVWRGVLSFSIVSLIFVYVIIGVQWSMAESSESTLSGGLKSHFHRNETQYGSINDACKIIQTVRIRDKDKWEKQPTFVKCTQYVRAFGQNRSNLKAFSFADLILNYNGLVRTFDLLVKKKFFDPTEVSIENLSDFKTAVKSLNKSKDLKLAFGMSIFYKWSGNTNLGFRASRKLARAKSQNVKNIAHWSTLSLYASSARHLYLYWPKSWVNMRNGINGTLNPEVKAVLKDYRAPKEQEWSKRLLGKAIVYVHANRHLFRDFDTCKCDGEMEKFLQFSENYLGSDSAEKTVKSEIVAMITRAALMADNEFFWSWFEKLTLGKLPADKDNALFFDQIWAYALLAKRQGDEGRVKKAMAKIESRISEMKKFPNDVGYTFALGSKYLFMRKFICSDQRMKDCLKPALANFNDTKFVKAHPQFIPADLHWLNSELLLAKGVATK